MASFWFSGEGGFKTSCRSEAREGVGMDIAGGIGVGVPLVDEGISVVVSTGASIGEEEPCARGVLTGSI